MDRAHEGQRSGCATQRRLGPVHRVPTASQVAIRRGDADFVRWTFEITIRRADDGQLDFSGPFVYGARGERALGLRWGTLADDDTFDVFRAAKAETV